MHYKTSVVIPLKRDTSVLLEQVRQSVQEQKAAPASNTTVSFIPALRVFESVIITGMSVGYDGETQQCVLNLITNDGVVYGRFEEDQKPGEADMKVEKTRMDERHPIALKKSNGGLFCLFFLREETVFTTRDERDLSEFVDGLYEICEAASA